jgi:predicted nucleotidyltransferase
MYTKEDVLNKLTNAKAELQGRLLIARLALFGSYSKGVQHEESDIDILFHPEEGTSFGLKEAFDLNEYFQELFAIEKVDVVNGKFINPIIELDIEDSLIYV